MGHSFFSSSLPPVHTCVIIDFFRVGVLSNNAILSHIPWCIGVFDRVGVGLSISGGTAADQAVDLRYGFGCMAEIYWHVLWYGGW